MTWSAPAPPSDARAVPVRFLMFNVGARDGVSRTVITLANHLARTHPVEIISLYRRGGGPAYRISDRIRVTYLLDHEPVSRATRAEPGNPGFHHQYAGRLRTRHPVRNILARRRSRLAHGLGFPNYSLLTDRLLARTLRTLEGGVLISTRPALHLAAVRLAPRSVVTIGQDHLNFGARQKEVGSMAFIEEACARGLRAFVTLTPSDAADYEPTLGGTRTLVTAIPNALSWPLSPARPHPDRVVVAAGRLVPRKGMARLIRAFAPVARRHPDWHLRIYGNGPLEPRLRQRVERLDVAGQIHLMGHTDDLPAAFDEAAVFASASSSEGFPMVMLEALSKGLPLVATDCPRGPGDIVRHRVNGLLVPNRDVEALSAALEEVVADDDLRESLAAQALADASNYVIDHVAAMWDDLFATLGASGQESL